MADATALPIPTFVPPDLSNDLFPKIVAPYIGAVFLELFLYGVYAILLTICIYVLLRRKRTLHWVLLSFALCMFSLASADVGYTLYIFFSKLLSGDLTFSTLYPKYVMFVTNTVLADSLLVYRCYVVWGGKKRVIAGPVTLLIAAAVCGYLFEGANPNLFKHAPIFLSMTFALNIILTSLTAGRIWYLAHRAEHIIGQGLLKRYNASIAILIESGAIYSIYMGLDLAFHKDPTGSAILDAGLIQIVGIVPTLIIVQVGLGRAMHSLDSESGNGAIGDDGQAIARVSTNRATMRSSVHTAHDARSSMHMREGSLRSAHYTMPSPRSHRGSNATLSPELLEHRKSFRSTYSASTRQGSVPYAYYPRTTTMNDPVSPGGPNSALYGVGGRVPGGHRTVYDLRLNTDSSDMDSYPIPQSPRSLPPSPVLVKPELSFNSSHHNLNRSLDGKIYHAGVVVFPDSMSSRDSTRKSGDGRDPYFSPV